MPQLSLYLDDATFKDLRADAALANKSLSRFVADELRARKNAQRWPEGFFDLYGCITEEDNFSLPEDSVFDTEIIAPLDGITNGSDTKGQ